APPATATIICGAALDPGLEDEVRMTVIATGFAEQKMRLEPSGKVLDLARTPRSAGGTSGTAAPAWRRRLGDARAEGDSPLDAEHDYDVPTFLRRSAD